ncbi:glucose-6-phosphate dehydrogenase [Candidatus Daviesbacteria bacterium]|nr:glucose-6-phosphate dehydrogenase [Candidatus Daviesbacteria bacterium]
MDSFALIIFGITGNLVQKYLLQALYDMAEKGLLPPKMSIVGIARKVMNKKDFKKYLYDVLHMENIHHRHPIKQNIFNDMANRLHYIDGHLDDPQFYKRLNKFLDTLTKKGINCSNRIYYLATYPDLYSHVFENLQKMGMNRQKNGYVRLMIEKPIGNDLKSAQSLNKLLLGYFSEDQIYRLDHYLGKETIQNILTFRFSNDIFEPLINRDYIDHIQISATEDFGIGARGGYYDMVGALKDVGQNHQLQMLAFSTMNAPSEFSNEAITAQRLKILQNLKPLPQKVVFGQYEGYTKEDNVSPKSQTETFYALKTYLENDRFKGVPVYIRAGKKLKQTVTEISLVFKNPQNRLFKHITGGTEANILIYRITPNEGIVLKIATKGPGHQAKLDSEYMQFCYKLDPHSHYIPDPYERLITDTIRGDQTFFNSAEEVEAQWAFIDPLVVKKGHPHIYKPGSWGPKEADDLLKADGRVWLEPSMDFCRI